MPRKSQPQEPSNMQNILRAYALFDHAERHQHVLTIDYIAQMTGYTSGTVRSYITKKWWWFLHLQPSYGYKVEGLHTQPKDYFIHIHRQRVQPNPQPPVAPSDITTVTEYVHVLVDRPWQVSELEEEGLLLVLALAGVWWWVKPSWRRVWRYRYIWF